MTVLPYRRIGAKICIFVLCKTVLRVSMAFGSAVVVFVINISNVVLALLCRNSVLKQLLKISQNYFQIKTCYFWFSQLLLKIVRKNGQMATLLIITATTCLSTNGAKGRPVTLKTLLTETCLSDTLELDNVPFFITRPIAEQREKSRKYTQKCKICWKKRI